MTIKHTNDKNGKYHSNRLLPDEKIERDKDAYGDDDTSWDSSKEDYTHTTTGKNATEQDKVEVSNVKVFDIGNATTTPTTGNSHNTNNHGKVSEQQGATHMNSKYKQHSDNGWGHQEKKVRDPEKDNNVSPRFI